MPRTILEIKTFIDGVIAAVTQEILDAAAVPPFPSEHYSDLLESRLLEELTPVISEEYTRDWLVTRDYDACLEAGFIVIEFTFDNSMQVNRVRYEVLDPFYPVSR